MPHEPMVDRILALIPEDGSRIPYGELAWRARKHLWVRDAGPFISQLCTDRRAISETIDGWQFVRRFPRAGTLVLLARPKNAPPRLRQRQHTAPAVKRVSGWR